MIEIIERRIARLKKDSKDAIAIGEDRTPILAALVELMELREEVLEKAEFDD